MAVSSVAGIDILKKGLWDPGTDEEYNSLPRAEVHDPNDVRAIAEVLANEARLIDTPVHRNHPTTCYYGILEVTFSDGTHAYLRYELVCTREEGYLVAVWSYPVWRGDYSYDGGGRPRYESKALVPLLRRLDPWFDDLSGPDED